jgi:hypothetical protein
MHERRSLGRQIPWGIMRRGHGPREQERLVCKAAGVSTPVWSKVGEWNPWDFPEGVESRVRSQL